MLKKKEIIISAVIVFVVGFISIFFLHLAINVEDAKEEAEIINLERRIIFEELENYIIKEEEGRWIISNEIINLSFSAPSLWVASKEIIDHPGEESEKAITLKSPDYEAGDHLYPEKGCKIYLTVYQEENHYQYLEQKIEDTLLNNNEKELLEVKGSFGLVYETDHSIITRTPIDKRIHEIGLYISSEDNNCKDDYYSLIDTITPFHD